MPRIVIDGLNITRFLSLETGNYLHLTSDDRKRVDALVVEGVRRLQEGRLFVSVLPKVVRPCFR